MHVFNSRADFDAQMQSVKKWMRTGQALDGVADLQHDVAYSIGDSLVYWWVYAREAATADLVGHRRYHAVLAPLDGDLTVEVAPKAGLTCTRAYSDIDDRERFEGTGETVTIPAGGVSLNARLRARLQDDTAAQGLRLLLAPPCYCGDNAAMVAALAAAGRGLGSPSAWDLDACPNLRIGR